MAPQPTCRACGADLSASDKFCGDCGAKVAGEQPPITRTVVPPGQPPIQAAVAPARPQPQAVYVAPAQQGYAPAQQGYAPPPPSSAFAIITLVFYFVLFPVGALLNLIGILTGPRRGCFAAMLFFILLPVVIIVAVIAALIATGKMAEIEKFVEQKIHSQDFMPQQNPLPGNNGLNWEPPKN